MKRYSGTPGRLFAATLLALGLASCSDGNDDNGDGGLLDPPDAELTGNWVLTVAPTSPPRPTCCNGDIAALAIEFCPTIHIPIEQTGALFSGTGAAPECGNDYSLSGTVSGIALSGTLVETGPAGTTRTNFSGVMTDPDSMTLALTTMTVDGVGGTCTLSGGYDGARTQLVDPRLTLTLLASPVSAAPDPNLDPTEQFYFSTIYGQLLRSDEAGGASSTTNSGATATSTPLVGVSVTFSATSGNLRFNACQQGVCSLDGNLCPSGVADCVQPAATPITLETDEAGVVQARVAVTDDDPANITVTAISGALSQNVSFYNPLSAPNDAPEAAIGVSPSSPADASNGPATVAFFSESTDPDGDEITCYEWTIASSTSATSVVRGSHVDVVIRSYGTEQTLNVLLRVTDDPGAATSCTADTSFSPNVDTISGYLICANHAPMAAFAVDSVETQVTTVEFRVDGSISSDPESGIQHYRWDCGNGQNPTGMEATCTYNRTTVTRFYEIELVVTDYSVESSCELESLPAVQTVSVPALGAP